MKILVSIALLILMTNSVLNVFSEIRLPAIIGCHMVLQQNSLVKLWGWCDPSEKISINTDLDTAAYSTTGTAGGKWTIQMKTPAAGGPYRITIKGSNTIILEDVMFGEVWDCSGQSNMEMNYNWGIKEYTSDAENATNSKIRFFHIPRLSANYPQGDTKAKWVVCTPDDMKRFSLAGYFFGQKLQQTLQVPVGLINASWGGTPAEAWTPKDSIENQPVLKEIADHLSPIPWGPVNAGAIYNAMIYPITNFTIAGVIWYQGEANVDNASTYNLLFSTMINSWRATWQKDLPFYFVQIAPFAGYGKNISAALLREAQTKTLSIPNTGMVVIDDLVTDTNNIHPHNKKDVALRLANSVLAEVYGKKGISYKSPTYKNMQIEKGRIRIYLDNIEGGLMSRGEPPSEFYIAGDDKKFVPATAKIEGNTILVWNKNIPAPSAVRFGFTNSAIPNLFSTNGLPVNIFRTDNWNDVHTRATK